MDETTPVQPVLRLEDIVDAQERERVETEKRFYALGRKERRRMGYRGPLPVEIAEQRDAGRHRGDDG